MATPEQKRDHLLAVLQTGVALVHLDARRVGVVVPEPYRGFWDLRLTLSWRHDPPDLRVDEWGVRCTLSFHGRQYPVQVPWWAVFGVRSTTTGAFHLYPAAIPQEWEPPEPPRPRGQLRLVN